MFSTISSPFTPIDTFPTSLRSPLSAILSSPPKRAKINRLAIEPLSLPLGPSASSSSFSYSFTSSRPPCTSPSLAAFASSTSSPSRSCHSTLSLLGASRSPSTPVSEPLTPALARPAMMDDFHDDLETDDELDEEEDVDKKELFPSLPLAEFHWEVMRRKDGKQYELEMATLAKVVPPSDTYEVSGSSRLKNRYQNVIPNAATRVTLSVLGGDKTSDYINASHIRPSMPATHSSLCAIMPFPSLSLSSSLSSTPSPPSGPSLFGGREYIAAQAPVPFSFSDWWRMVWEKNITIILMLTKCVERERVKAHVYWPDRLQQARLYGAIRVKLEEMRTNKAGDVVTRVFSLCLKGETRLITKLQYTGWPDMGVPSDFSSFLTLMQAYRQLREQPQPELVSQVQSPTLQIPQQAQAQLPDQESERTLSTPRSASLPKTAETDPRTEREEREGQGSERREEHSAAPVLTHCSAGIGRTGTFIVIDVLLDQLASSRERQSLNIFKIVRRLRTQRQGMVQSKEQYRFCYEFLDFCVQHKLFNVQS